MSATRNPNGFWQPHVLSLMRIVVGLLFVDHGTSKLLGFPHSAMFDHLQLFSLIGVAGVVELVCGGLVCIGLLTRPAALIASGEMAIAYFMVHLPKSPFPVVNGGDAAILYCFVFLYLVFAGGAVWSIDHVVWRITRPRYAGGGFA